VARVIVLEKTAYTGGAGMTFAMVSGFLSAESAAEYIAAK